MINQKPKLYHSQTHPSSSKDKNDAKSVFRFLPVAIFALASSLPSHDQEVLAYMLTRSIFITSTTPRTRKEKRPVKKSHKTLPIRQCWCFECYTSFWFRWDSSPNRELIHEAIEAFEEHLMVTNDVFSEKQSRGKQRGGKRVMGRNQFDVTGSRVESGPVLEKVLKDMDKSTKFVAVEEEENVSEEVTGNLEIQVVTGLVPVSNNRKGLTRKVLPDLVGLINSRFWSIWSPGF